MAERQGRGLTSSAAPEPGRLVTTPAKPGPPETYAVRMGMSVAEGEHLADLLLRCPPDVAERVHDQLWLRSVLVEQRRRTRIAERPTFDARADRILELLDPQEPTDFQVPTEKGPRR